MKYPLKLSVRSELIPFVLIVGAWILSIYFYMHFPDKVPTHWNVQGEVDGWSSKSFGAFMLPAIMTGTYLLFLVFPILDPKKERYQEFFKPFWVFRVALIAIFFALYVLTGLAGLGFSIPIGIMVPALIGGMFIVIGNYFGKVKSNWLFGIRTPWTLSSETVWNKTHRLGGKMFIIGGVLLLFMGLLPSSWVMPVFILVIILAALVPMVYSYLEYRKEEKHR